MTEGRIPDSPLERNRIPAYVRVDPKELQRAPKVGHSTKTELVREAKLRSPSGPAPANKNDVFEFLGPKFPGLVAREGCSLSSLPSF